MKTRSAIARPLLIAAIVAYSLVTLEAFAEVFTQVTVSPGQSISPEHERLLSALYGEEKKLRQLSEMDYATLVAALPGVEAIIQEQGFLARVRSPQGAVHDRYVWSDLATGYSYASLLAPDREDARKWALREHALWVQVFSHPESQRLWRSYERGKPEPIELQRLFRWIADFPSSRRFLVERDYISADDWGMLAGLTWTDRPGAVIRRDGVVFVEQSALQAVNVPVQPGAGAVTIANGDRKAIISLGSPVQASARRGFRDASGRVYIPVKELSRQRVYSVEIPEKSQMVRLWNEVPPAGP